MTLRPQSSLGWLMLQWLGAIVPELAFPVPPRETCGCCSREVLSSNIDGLYGCCDTCADCLSLGHCFDLDESDGRHVLLWCRGENHKPLGLFFKSMDREKGTITISDSPPNLHPRQLEALHASGQVMAHTQPPPFPRDEAISKGGLFTWEPGEPAWRRI